MPAETKLHMGKSPYVQAGIRETGAPMVEQLAQPEVLSEEVDFSPESKETLVAQAKKAGGKYRRTLKPANGSATPTLPVPPKHPAAVLIDSVLQNDDFTFVGTQFSPRFIQNIEVPKIPSSAMREWFQSNYPPGGRYQVQVFNTIGGAIPDDKGGVLPIVVPIPPQPPSEEKPLSDRVKEEKQKAAEIKATREKEAEAAELERDRAERAAQKNNPQQSALEKKLEDLERKLEEERRERDRLAAQPKEDPTTKALLSALVAAVPALVTNLTAPKAPDTSAEKLANAMERMMDKQVQANKDMLTAVEKMNDKTLQTIRETKKEDGLAQYLKMEESLMNRLERFGAFAPQPPEQKTPTVDPNNIIGSVIAAAIELGYKFISDEKTGKGVGDFLSAMSKRLEKPQAQWTVADIPRIEALLSQLKSKGSLPAPGASQAATNPQQVVTEIKTADIVAAAAAPATPPPQPEAPKPAIPEPPRPVSSADEQADLKESVEESIRQLILDLKAEREVEGQKWYWIVLKSCGKDFVAKIQHANIWTKVKATVDGVEKEVDQFDPTERLKLFQQFCKPELFAQLVELLSQDKYMLLFNGGITEMLNQKNNPS